MRKSQWHGTDKKPKQRAQHSNRTIETQPQVDRSFESYLKEQRISSLPRDSPNPLLVMMKNDGRSKLSEMLLKNWRHQSADDQNN